LRLDARSGSADALVDVQALRTQCVQWLDAQADDRTILPRPRPVDEWLTILLRGRSIAACAGRP
jgi:hypothetical protein